jgi:uncharacterized protein (DUF362 family)
MNTKVAYTNASSYDLDVIKNSLYEIFISLGYDKNNPLGHIIKPGMHVFIKPNWVASRWRESCLHKDDLYCVITHPNVIEAIADFVDIALNGEGLITIGDNPSIDADFNELLDTTKITKLESKYRIPCEIFDLRQLVCKDLRDYGDKTKMSKQSGDPRAYTEINLAEKSMFTNINSSLFRGVFKQRGETLKAHNETNHLYTYANSIYNSDVYISIPKMKTHHKAGVTLNLKGLVGTIGNKNQLVHWKIGFPFFGGDEYSSFLEWIKGTFLTKTKSRGSWSGNDTIWRMVVDLYQGMMLRTRKYFSVVDGILAGEGTGPFCPNGKKANILVAGEDLLAVDIVTTRLMGFNYKQIPYLNYLYQKASSFDKIIVCFNNLSIHDFFNSKDAYLNFTPPPRWENIKI